VRDTGPRYDGPTALTDDDRVGLAGLLADVAARDGVEPLSEEHLIALRPEAPPARAWVVRDAARVVGLASRRGDAVEVVVHPEHRRRGLGRALVTAALDDAAAQPALGDPSAPSGPDAPPAPGVPAVWAHGDLAPARALAADLGLVRARELLRLERASRPGDAELPELPGALRLADLPASEREAALRSWLRLNAVAFRDHPEQGRWTWEDVATRVAEPWFDPSLLLLVPDDAGSDLAASLWIKPQPPVGGRERAEVYVVAVHPDATGRGLGRSLLDHALGLLARRGVRYVELYVDGGNAPAVRLYDRAGFGVVERHAQYVRGASSTA